MWYKKSGAHAWNSTGHAPRKQRSTTTKDNIPSKAKAVKWIFSGGISLCVTNIYYSNCFKKPNVDFVYKLNPYYSDCEKYRYRAITAYKAILL